MKHSKKNKINEFSLQDMTNALVNKFDGAIKYNFSSIKSTNKFAEDIVYSCADIIREQLLQGKNVVIYGAFSMSIVPSSGRQYSFVKKHIVKQSVQKYRVKITVRKSIKQEINATKQVYSIGPSDNKQVMGTDIGLLDIIKYLAKHQDMQNIIKTITDKSKNFTSKIAKEILFVLRDVILEILMDGRRIKIKGVVQMFLHRFQHVAKPDNNNTSSTYVRLCIKVMPNTKRLLCDQFTAQKPDQFAA